VPLPQFVVQFECVVMHDALQPSSVHFPTQAVLASSQLFAQVLPVRPVWVTFGVSTLVVQPMNPHQRDGESCGQVELCHALIFL